MDRGLEAVTVCAMKHEAFILRTKAGQWMFQVHRDGVEIGGGAGFADQFEAIEGGLVVKPSPPHIARKDAP